MTTRRLFLQTAVASATATAQPAAFRSISYNVLSCLGYGMSNGDSPRLLAARPQMEERMALELALYQADVITFAESVTRDAAERLARRLGMQFAYFDPGVASYSGYPIGFPGTLFTRHKILESQNSPRGKAGHDPELFTRHWGRAVIETSSETIVVFSGHMHPSNQQIRSREIGIMASLIQDEIRQGKSVLFQGDLNHTPEGPEYRRWREIGLIDTFAAAGVGEPATFSTREPKGRIDYIWVAGPLAKRLKEARVLNEGAFRMNPADPQSFALSDHLPVTAVFAR